MVKTSKKKIKTELTSVQENKTINLPLSEEEKKSIEQWENKKFGRTTQFVVKKEQDGTTRMLPDSNSKRGSEEERIKLFSADICRATGTKSAQLGMHFLFHSVSACGLFNDNQEKNTESLNLIMDSLIALEPKDEFEGMLISHLVSLHFQIMEFMSRSIIKEQKVEFVDINVNRVTKLTRLYNETLESLMRYRRKGEQKVIVQHVNVNDGGKAIVGGNMAMGGGGVQQ